MIADRLENIGNYGWMGEEFETAFRWLRETDLRWLRGYGTVFRVMDMLDIPSEGYIPVYSRNELTDALHEAFGFRTDNQITSGRTIRKLSANTKKANPLTF